MSGVNVKQLDSLAGPTPPDEIRTRQGPGGRNLSYVDARYVMGRLDELGPENWQRDQRAIGDRVACGIGILIEDVGWVWKWDGAGDTDIEGDKGAFSDSFKRAAVNWGIARDLYRPSQPAAGTSSPARPAAVARQELHSPAAAAAHSVHVVSEEESAWMNAPMGPPECPIHHKPYRSNARGMFCANKLDDGSWCKEPRRAA